MSSKIDVLCGDDDDVECANCPWTGKGAQLKPIERFFERVTAGEAAPAGECPECGCLCHVVIDHDDHDD